MGPHTVAVPKFSIVMHDFRSVTLKLCETNGFGMVEIGSSVARLLNLLAKDGSATLANPLSLGSGMADMGGCRSAMNFTQKKTENRGEILSCATRIEGTAPKWAV